MKDTIEPLSLQQCLAACAIALTTRVDDLRGPSQERCTAFARHVAAYVMSTYTRAPDKLVGKRLGRDRSTIVYGKKRIHKLLRTDDDTRSLIERIVKLAVSLPKAPVDIELFVSVAQEALADGRKIPAWRSLEDSFVSTDRISSQSTLDKLPTRKSSVLCTVPTGIAPPASTPLFDLSWWEANDTRFCRAMMTVHPERYSKISEAAE